MGGTESQGISRVGQTVLARLIESQIWHPPADSVWGGFRKGTVDSVCLSAPPALSLLLDTSVPPCVPLVPFKLLPWCWSSEGMSLS